MNRYEIIIFWSDEDNAFVADVPALPGCMAHGDSHESALAAAKDAVALWLEKAHATGRVVPQSRGARLPSNVPVGSAEAIVLSDTPSPSADDASMAQQGGDLDAFFELLKTVPPSGRTIQEIDRQIQEERDSWER